MTAITRPVLYFSRFVPDYRLPVLRSLNERLDGRLVICAGSPPGMSSLAQLSSSPDKSIQRVELKNHWIGGERLHWQSYKKALSLHPNARVLLVEESPRSASLPFLLRAARKHNKSIVLWGHFSSNSRPLGSGDMRDRIRMSWAKNADALLCYTDEGAEQLRNRLKRQAVFVARNTLDTDVLFDEHDRFLREGKVAVRERLGLPHKHTLLFIGRLIKDKGVDRVLQVGASLGSDTTSVVIIGDGPERSNLERQALELGLDVKFTGAMTDLSESAPFIYASDLLLNPGYLGLSVNHAFSLGLPVVASSPPQSDVRMHSPEWSYVTPGQTGEFSELGTVDSLKGACRKVFEDQQNYSEKASAYARQELNIGRMVDGLVEAIEYAELSRKKLLS